jgi:hypothetical protein
MMRFRRLKQPAKLRYNTRLAGGVLQFGALFRWLL